MSRRGAGVSASPLSGGRWRIRWRERRTEGGWSSREWTITGDEHDRDEACLRVRRALADGGRFERPAATAAPLPEGGDGERSRCVVAAMRAYLTHQARVGRHGPATQADMRHRARWLAGVLRQVAGVKAGGVVPTSVLNRETVARVMEIARAELAPATAQARGRLLVVTWRWMLDDPSWGAPPGAQRVQDWLPAPPVYGRTVAPSVDDVGALFAAIGPTVRPRSVAKLMLLRYTGARLAEVEGLRRRDFDLARAEVVIRGGKTVSAVRVVPLAPALLAEPGFRAFLDELGDGPIAGVSMSRMVTAAWERSGVPRSRWEPPNRAIRRPHHALRAAFRSELILAGARPDVVSAMIGHKAHMADAHYGRDLEDEMRRAVVNMPPIPWGDARNLADRMNMGRSRAPDQRPAPEVVAAARLAAPAAAVEAPTTRAVGYAMRCALRDLDDGRAPAVIITRRSADRARKGQGALWVQRPHRIHELPAPWVLIEFLSPGDTGGTP